MSDKTRKFSTAPQAFEIAGEKYTLRQLRLAERRELIKLADGKTEDDKLAIMVAYFLGDAKGERVFSNSELSDIDDVPVSVAMDIVARGNAFNFPGVDEKKT